MGLELGATVVTGNIIQAIHTIRTTIIGITAEDQLATVCIPIVFLSIDSKRIFIFVQLKERNTLKCEYSVNRTMLKCTSSPNTVECETFGLFTEHSISYYSNFAISATPIGDLSQPEFLKLQIYPKAVQDRCWLNSSYTLNNLFGNKITEPGFGVYNSTCFAKLVDLFSSAATESIAVSCSTEKMGQVDVFGTIRVSL